MARCTAMASSDSAMAATIKATSSMTKNRVTASTTGATVERTTASGMLANSMEKARLSKQTVAGSKESGRTASASPGLNESTRGSKTIPN